MFKSYGTSNWIFEKWTKECQEFSRDEKSVSHKDATDEFGHERSSRNANSTGSIIDFNWNQNDVCLTKFGNENTLRNHLLTHGETDDRVEDAVLDTCDDCRFVYDNNHDLKVRDRLTLKLDRLEVTNSDRASLTKLSIK